MRAIRAASAAALGCTALILTACTAAAAAGRNPDPFTGSVTPAAVAPGGQVLLHSEGCKGQVDVSSGIFDTQKIPPQGGSVKAPVDWDAKQGGVYAISFACADGSTRTAELTIEDQQQKAPAARQHDEAPAQQQDAQPPAQDQGRPAEQDQGQPPGQGQGRPPGQEHGRPPGQDQGQPPGQEHGQDHAQPPGQDHAQGHPQNHAQQPPQEHAQEHPQKPADPYGQPPADPWAGTHTQHGVKAGVGGSLGGLDLQDIGLGAALVAGTLATVYYRSRTRPEENGS